MTSAINPNNIDGNYPVAGVPNNTQGMRDNFTNTKTNFQFAADEITDLQINGVFKAALTGTTLDNNMNDNLIYAVKLQDLSYTPVAITGTTGSITVDYSAGQFQSINTTGSISLSFTNFPASGSAGWINLIVTVNSTAHTMTLPAAVSVGTVGVQGFASNVITFGAIGTYQFRFYTSDGGTTVTLFDLNRPLLGSSGLAIGYAVGAGGTVSQATDKSTGVTLDAYTGQITMNGAALSGAAIVSFTLTNSRIASGDVLVLNHVSGGTLGAYTLNAACGSGSAVIYVRNSTAGSLSEAIVIRFAVIRGQTT